MELTKHTWVFVMIVSENSEGIGNSNKVSAFTGGEEAVQGNVFSWGGARTAHS